MVTASQFAQDIMGPLEIRQEIHSLKHDVSGNQTAPDNEITEQLEGRIDEVVRNYWIESTLSLAEQFGDRKKRPLKEEDIPMVAASMCIQFLMSGAFPNFEQRHAQNLLDGSRANPDPDEVVDIDSLETSTVKWLGHYLEYGERAKSGTPILVSNTKQFLHITGPPQVEIQTKHKNERFFAAQTKLTLGTSMTSSVKDRSPVPIFSFMYEPQELVSPAAVLPFKDLSKPLQSHARGIIDVVKASNRNISFKELFMLIVAKQSGLVKRTPKETINVELAQNRRLSTQDEESIKKLKSAASRVGISFTLVHPKPPKRVVINGKKV